MTAQDKPSTSYELRRTESGFEIIGPPEGSKAFLLNDKTTDRMKKIRLAEYTLKQAKDILDEGNRSISKDNLLMREAISIAASTNYAAVLKSGSLALQLDANSVFKDMPDALDRHNDWMAIRHHRYNHHAEVGRTLESCVIHNADGTFHDAVTFLIDRPVGQNHDWMHPLDAAHEGNPDLQEDRQPERGAAAFGSHEDGQHRQIPRRRARGCACNRGSYRDLSKRAVFRDGPILPLPR